MAIPLKKFNEPTSQTSIYIKSGVGTSTYLEGTKNYNKSYFIGSSADWETKDYMQIMLLDIQMLIK